MKRATTIRGKVIGTAVVHGKNVVLTIAAAKRISVALEEAQTLLDLCDPEGIRAKEITAPEDAEVAELCERHGYGAVMDSAARLWRRKTEALPSLSPPGSSHTKGPAVASVQRGLDLVRAALGYRKAVRRG